MRDFVQREFKEVTAPSPYFSHNLAENCRSVDRDWLSGGRGQCCVIRPRPPESQDRSTECASFPRGCEKYGLDQVASFGRHPVGIFPFPFNGAADGIGLGNRDRLSRDALL